MSREQHAIYNKAVLAFKNDNLDIFKKVLNSLELTRTEEVLLRSREMIANNFFRQARSLLLKLNVSSSHYLNGERALLLGHCYSELHDTIKCRYSYSAALKEFVLCQDRKGQFLCHLLLGRSLLEGGLIPLALKHLNEAKSLAIGSHEETLVSRHLAKLYIQTGNEQKALLFIETVLRKADELGEKDGEAFRKLADHYYQKIGQSALAEKARDRNLKDKVEH